MNPQSPQILPACSTHGTESTAAVTCHQRLATSEPTPRNATRRAARSVSRSFRRVPALTAALLTVGSLLAASPALAVGPSAVDDSETVPFESMIMFEPLANDVEANVPLDPSTIAIVTPPNSGDLMVDYQTGEMLFFPAERFVGLVSFQYTVADENGDTSNTAWVDIDVELPLPPVIVDFVISQGSYDAWHFDGEVDYPHPEDLTITFGGVLEGETVSVNADGTFNFSKLLTNNEEGLVTTQTVDEYGQESNIAEDAIYRF